MARKKHKARRSKGRLGKVIQFLCIVAVLAAMTVGATVFFQVEQIEVSGNHRYTQEEIVAVTGIVAGDNLFRMNKFAIQDRVKEEMPYIEDILIRRKLPSTITVAVQEWDAVARVLPNSGWVPPEPEETADRFALTVRSGASGMKYLDCCWGEYESRQCEDGIRVTRRGFAPEREAV